MKLIVARDTIHAALGAVARIVEARNTIPILSNVLLVAEGDALKLRATDLDIEAEASVEARIAAPGAITVPANLLHALVTKTPPGAEVTLEMADNQLNVRAGRSKFKLNTLPADDYPNLEAIQPTHRFRLAAKAFGEMLTRTAFAISTEETRYYLNGIYVHAVGGRLRTVATNGHILARLDGAEIADADSLQGVIVPRKAVGELAKLCGRDSGVVEIAISPTKFAAAFSNGVRLTSKVVDGTFPDYVRVIPSNNENIGRADRESFVASVDRVGTLSSSGAAGKKIKLGLADGVMALEVNNPDSGSSRDEIDVEYEAAPIEIGFNARYLLDILAVMPGPQVEMRFADPGSPALLQTPNDPSAVFVIMPLC